jgi:colanic acid/amylovoran biosynthesis glycosyltransferase
MKVAIFSGEIPSSAFIENLISELSKKSDPEIILFGKKKGHIYYKGNVKIRYFPRSFFRACLLLFIYSLVLVIQSPSAFYTVAKLTIGSGMHLRKTIETLVKRFIVLSNRPDIFHVQWIKEGHEWLFLRKFGVRVIGSFRGAHIHYSPVANKSLAGLYHQTFPCYDAFHSVSSHLAKEAAKYGDLKGKVFRIPGAVDSKMVKDIIEPKSLLSKRPLNILSIGRSHWIKGYQYALDACAVLKNRGVQFKYTIVGTSADEELLFQVHDLGISEEVIFTGEVSHQKVADFYDAADVFLLPSLNEGIANVVLESMARGVPVVSTDCGGMSEVIKNGENGLLVPVRDSMAIANVLTKLLNEELNIRSMISAAKKTIVQNYLLEGQVNDYRQMYHDVFQKKRINFK